MILEHITFRSAVKADIPELIECAFLLNQTQGDNTKPDETLLQDKWSEQDIFVAEYDERLIGFGSGQSSFSFYMGFDRYFINSLFLMEEFRGQGIGKKLLQFIIETKIDEGQGLFDIQVLKDNEPANKLYESLGFQKKPDHYNRLILLKDNYE